MTVTELRDQLAGFPPDAEVFIETLDDVWVANYVDRDNLSGDTVVIIGSEEVYEDDGDNDVQTAA